MAAWRFMHSGSACMMIGFRSDHACITHKSETDWMHARDQPASARAWPAASGQLAGWRVTFGVPSPHARHDMAPIAATPTRDQWGGRAGSRPSLARPPAYIHHCLRSPPRIGVRGKDRRSDRCRTDSRVSLRTLCVPSLRWALAPRWYSDHPQQQNHIMLRRRS